MNDANLSLALAIHTAPGTIAVLLGSGISRPASIPTGWDVVCDLIRKVAAMEGQSCEPDPVAWFVGRFGSPPDYAALLDKLAATPAARQSLLRSYFEPNDDEREEGLKQPTQAHKAIADLAQKGFVRVIVTTNFDRLMERALEDVGISPTVIASPDALAGAPPLVHAHCTVVKVHGDYLDTRILNTPDELSNYAPEMDRLLDRIFDEFGMIVAGWSADYDTALRAAILRRQARRYGWYWALHGTLGASAQSIIETTGAQVLPINGADDFFTKLTDMVKSLVDISGLRPLIPRVAQTTLKRILLKPEEQPRIQDLVRVEIEHAIQILLSGNLENSNASIVGPEVRRRLAVVEGSVHTLLPLYATAGYFGQTKPPIWRQGFERILTLNNGSDSGYVFWLRLRRHPATLLLYAAGIGGLVGGDMALFADLARFEIKLHTNNDLRGPAHADLFSSHTLYGDGLQALYEETGQGKSASNLTASVLRGAFTDLLPAGDVLDRAFDRFEYLMSVMFIDAISDQRWPPIGDYVYRSRHQLGFDVVRETDNELSRLGTSWPPLKAGLFGGSVDRFRAAASTVEQYLRGIPS